MVMFILRPNTNSVNDAKDCVMGGGPRFSGRNREHNIKDRITFHFALSRECG